MTNLLKSLASYVPNLILRRIAEHPEPITTPTFESFAAAVMYADITGFSTLTESLENVAFAEQGAGAEAVTTAINAYFEKFIEILQTNGGDIVKFTGDGVLALWPTDPNLPAVQIASALRDAVHRAAQCGLKVQETLAGYETPDGHALSMRIGIGAGDTYVAHLGGVFNRWEVLIAGDPVIQSHTAENHANPGEVILSANAYRLIRAHVNGTPLSFGSEGEGVAVPGREGVGLLLRNVLDPLAPLPLAEINLTPQVEAALRPYIPAAILTRLDAGQSAWLSELRRVTVLFINLPDLNQITAATLDQAQKAVREVQRSIYKQQGSLNKLNVDEKGATLVAALGLPPLSHMDDPERGAKAALDTEQALKALGISVSIGVATGLTFSGVIGSTQRREYTMMGAPVNLAARLMQAANRPQVELSAEGGPVLCDITTYSGANKGVVFAALLPVKVKGKHQPVPIFQPLKLRPSPLLDRHDEWARTLVGRAEERFTIAEQLQELQRGGAGGVFIIEGEAGIGKSRLVKEIMEQANALGITAFLGVGDVVERENLYHAWEPVFRRLLEVDEFSTTNDRPLKKIVRLLTDPELLRLYPLLSEVLDVKIDDNEYTSQMEGQVRANNTRHLLVRIFEEACKQSPSVLVIEDCQWLDTASWAVLFDIWTKVHPLLLVLATRPMDGQTPPEYLQITKGVETQIMRLSSLSPDEVVDLVCKCLGVSRIPEPIARLIQEKSEGHPFFSQELAYALRDGQYLQFNDDECIIAPNVNLHEISLPNTVQGVITSRIDSLPPTEQLLLKVASVIGRIFPYDSLHDLYPLMDDKPRLKFHLNTLNELDLTDLETADPHLAYFFKHHITQEVSYSLLPFAMRQQLHQQIAEWYEEKYADDLSPYYSMLGHHWSNAGVAPKAVEFLEKSGEKALRGGAYHEAIHAFKQALEWNEQIRHEQETTLFITRNKRIKYSEFQRARWEREIGQAYIGLGQIPASYQHLKSSLTYLGRPETTEPLPLIGHVLWQVIKQIYFRFVPKSASNIPEDGQLTVLEAARAFGFLSENYFYLKQNLPLTHAVIHTLNLTERAGLTPELASAYANMGMLMGVANLHPLARFYLKQALEKARALDLRAPPAYVNLIISLYSLGVGDWERVNVAIEESIQLYRELGDGRRLGEALSLKAIRLHFLGEFQRSNEVYAELHQMGENSGDIQQITWGLDGQATNLIRMGKLSRAADCLAKTQALFMHSNDMAEETVYYGTLAVLHLYEGNTPEAKKAAETALQKGSGTSPVYSTLEGYAGAVETFLTLMENGPEPERRTLNPVALQAVKALENHASRFPFCKPRALVWRGVYEALMGRRERAFRQWKGAIAEAQNLNLPFEEGLANFQIFRHLPKTDPARHEHLVRAREIFNQLEIRNPGIMF